MHAMNHAITALALKKKFDYVPLAWLLVSVQLMELLWIAFNWLGLEYISVENEVRTIADIHLEHMPYSHSIASAVLLAGIAYLAFRRPGLAIGLGILSHLVLDLLTHVPDIAVVWFGWDIELGTSIYALPLVAFTFETVYGLAIWRYVRGSIGLLAAIVVFQLGTLSAHVTWISGIEASLADKPTMLATGVAIQIAVTLPLVWWLSRRPSAPRVFATQPSRAQSA
ncbi:MAG: hypothetical protein KAJ97_11125 [Acidobacteria bacterium]|nr:hypothetical protein [Acidobacteriota bacterium]